MRLLAELEERALRDPLGLSIHQVLTTRVLDSHPLDQLQDLTPEAVKDFRRVTYKPHGSVLAVSSPYGPRKVFVDAIGALGAWHREAPPAQADATQPLPRPIGVHWREGDLSDSRLLPIEAALLFDLTPLTLPNTVEFYVALEVFAAGPVSRFARRLRQRLGYDVPMWTEWIENGPTQVFALRVQLPGAEAVPEVRTAIDESLQQLAVSEPTSDEISRAASRVRLRMLRDQDQPLAAR